MRPVPRHRRRLRLVSAVMAVAVALLSTVAAFQAPLAAADPASLTAPPATELTTEQAIAKARASGQPVPVPGATTATDTLTANPNGSLTLTRTATPARQRIGGVWRSLDPTLRRNSDGTITTTATTDPLTISAGGGGPLAVLQRGGHRLNITMPMALPAPALDRATATYPAVLPGVDLQIIADAQGGLRHVLIVKDATAAANPALRELTIGTTSSTGLTIASDGDGNLTATDRAHQPVFTAPTPLMWDSTRATSENTNTGETSKAPAAETSSNTPATDEPDIPSTPAGPGSAARVSPVPTKAGPGTITLTPQGSLLDGSATYPVYIDPGWSKYEPSKSGWATVTKRYPSTKYWNTTPEPNGLMQVGNADGFVSRTLVNIPINTGLLSGATIDSAKFYLTEVYAYSCTRKRLNLYAPAGTLTSGNATWNSWENGFGGVIAYGDYAYGYDGSCPAESIGFDVTGTIRNDVATGRTTRTFGLAAGSESDSTSWKKFLPSSAVLTVNYNHTPNTPSGMSTSPASACTAAIPTTVGDSQVALYAPVSDPDGGSLGVTYQFWKTTSPDTILASTNPSQLTYPSGSTAVFIVPQATLQTAAGGTVTQFSWRVQVTDTLATSGWSVTCSFNFDPTRTGQPTVTVASDPQIGQPATVQITPPPAGTTPSGYLYQLNGAPPQTIAASGDGSATITITPTRFTSVLAVTGTTPGGNLGDTATVTFNAAQTIPAADNDLTGDGIPDLLTIGAQNAFPAGLWLAKTTTSAVSTVRATNLGANGAGLNGDPTDFTSGQEITGHFTGTGLQDVLVYHPTGDLAGSAVILNGSGDGSVLQTRNGNVSQVDPAFLTDANGDIPLRFANAGNTSGRNLAYPDLIALSGSASNGYALHYYPSRNRTGSYQYPTQLTTPTPTGGTDWDTWTITTCQQPAGTTAMFLWQKTTGTLVLWTDLAYDLATSALTYNQRGSFTWNKGATVTIQAADIDTSGTPDLWAVSAGTATAWLTSGLDQTPTITAQPAKKLLTSRHMWLLNEHENGPVTTAADIIGTSQLAAKGNAVWHTGDLYSPDVLLNSNTANTLDPSGTGALTTTSPIIDTTKSFTVSVWVKPTITGGVILSEDGAHSSRFILWQETGDKTWRFGMADVDDTSWHYYMITGPVGKLGVWTHLVGTYDASTATMSLYVNGVLGGTAHVARTTSWPSTGSFVIGRYLYNNTPTAYYSGQISTVEVWDQTIDPTR